MVAHFDYYWNKGPNGSTNNKGVVLISRTTCGNSKMYDPPLNTGGYAGSIAHITTCPAIATALSTILGSYLSTLNLALTNALTTGIASMAGAGYSGASTSWAWTTSQCVFPSEIQIFGSTVNSSSFYDTGDACEKLAVFNFISHVEFSRNNFWLKDASGDGAFAYADGYGTNGLMTYNTNTLNVRPLIYIT